MAERTAPGCPRLTYISGRMFPDCSVITGLHLDCEGNHDCVRISRIALGLCKSVQSRSSSYYPSPISSARIVG